MTAFMVQSGYEFIGRLNYYVYPHQKEKEISLKPWGRTRSMKPELEFAIHLDLFVDVYSLLPPGGIWDINCIVLRHKAESVIVYSDSVSNLGENAQQALCKSLPNVNFMFVSPPTQSKSWVKDSEGLTLLAENLVSLGILKMT